MVLHIEAGLHRRQGKALTNFQRTLPAPQSDLAQQLLKDPYNFDFLTLTQDAHERDLETGLVGHIQRFLLELGVGSHLSADSIRWKLAAKIFVFTCSSTT